MHICDDKKSLALSTGDHIFLCKTWPDQHFNWLKKSTLFEFQRIVFTTKELIEDTCHVRVYPFAGQMQ